ncbi:hypothetical protein [Phytohabitans kaempferiae]|uniref:Uncharacterized protein n=1 Tax=Phytohabitans kaempferiae TaxID=1620943 RepID=A0ABV6MG76_9ACTN
MATARRPTYAQPTPSQKDQSRITKGYTAYFFSIDVADYALVHNLELTDTRTWSELVDAYEQVDPLGVLPVLRDLVLTDLRDADARGYQQAARRLRRMRNLAAGTDRTSEVDEMIGELREEHRRRPRLQREFDKAGLP